MEVKSKFTNLTGAEIFLPIGEIELIINTLASAEEQAEIEYNRELTEYHKARAEDDNDYSLVEITKKHLQEIRRLLGSFEDLIAMK